MPTEVNLNKSLKKKKITTPHELRWIYINIE